MNKQKTKYIKDKMVDTKNNWKFLKQYNKCKKSRPPDRLNCNGKMLSSPKELANIANNFFISKIEKIRRGFTPDEITPIEILEKLVPKNPNSFQIPMITIQQTIEIIDKIPNSSSVGHDNINNKFIKKIKLKIAPYITHLINTILYTKIYPQIYKITRILPLSKSGMDPIFIENYRPISNLGLLEK